MAEKATVTAVKKALEHSPKRNFVQTVDLSINLKDVDMSIPKNRIQEDIILPHGRGKPVKVCVFGSGEMVVKARDVADRVVSVEELGTIADDKKQAKKMANEFEYFIAEAPLMPTIGKRLGIVLGPRGKMPKPIPPGADPKPMIENLRRSISVRSRDRLTFHTAVGTTDMTPEDIADNIELIFKRLGMKLEKGTMNIRSAFVKTTMGPSEKVI
ncbi:MAG TPA: 50S ribosomal protein L1 [Methanomassiliicoccales archaeon]|nr:50S ribosomal protein L1 [Methanomassiliicoccales archaeon]HNX47365.1 50S ribosomal protein L1 [Methanomassiliicoccales archaeon]HPR98027.1 50S ribosomal protein L1 [Methanomassiliicoccales archaeon]HSA35008.1 50S ribosomal protein L1 [Methanomassiliicoccales archaeon]